MLEYYAQLEDENNDVSLSDSEQSEVVGNAVSEWLMWTDMTRSMRERALEARQLYLENRPDYQEYSTPDDASGSSSNIRRPALAQAIDSTAAQQHLSSYPSDERFFKGKPKNKVAADNMDQYEKWTEERIAKIDLLVNSFKDRINMMLDNASAVAFPYIRETKESPVYEQSLWRSLLGKKPRKKMVEKVVFEGTRFIPLNFEDWRVDPMVDRIEDTPFLWRRWASVEEIKSVKSFKNTEDLKTYAKTWSDDHSRIEEMYRYIGIEPQMCYEGSDKDIPNKYVLLYERWGDFYIDDKFYPNHVLIYSNDCTFHYFGENPHDHKDKPFAVSPYIPLPGTLYGKSIAQDVIPLCHALDTLLNQLIDILSRVSNPTFTYLVTDTALATFFEDGEVSLRPGEGIPCQSHESIRALTFDLNGLAIINASMQQLKEEIRESTGGVPYTTGGANQEDQERTLGEVQILASGTNTRFQMLIQNYEQMKLKPFLYQSYENDRQLMSAPAFVEGYEAPLLPNTVKMMDMTFDVLGSKSVLNKSRDIRALDSVMGMLPQLFQAGFAVPNGDTLKIDVPMLVKQAAQQRNLSNIEEIFQVEKAQAAMPQVPQLGVVPNGIPAIPGAGQAPQNPNMAAA